MPRPQMARSPVDAMLEALRANAPNKRHKRIRSIYDRCISVDTRGVPVADKVKVAHWLVEHGKLSLDVLDLERNVTRLVAFIKASNYSPPL
jgi:hypothetical protein